MSKKVEKLKPCQVNNEVDILTKQATKPYKIKKKEICDCQKVNNVFENVVFTKTKKSL